MKLNDLQTTGNEFLLNGKDYVGYYNINQINERMFYFTGRAFDSTSIPLEVIPIVVKRYQVVSSLRIGDPPTAFYPSPTSVDYKRGWFNRYFAKKTNDKFAQITEISKDLFDKVSSRDNNIDWALYRVIELRWKITGNMTDIFDVDTNKFIEPGVIDTNTREIVQAEKSMSGIYAKLSNLLEFYQALTISKAEIQRANNAKELLL